MLTPKEVVKGRAEFVKSYIDLILRTYESDLKTQQPKDEVYYVEMPSSPSFSQAEKDEIRAALEAAFTEAGWEWERTHTIFSSNLKPASHFSYALKPAS